MRKREGIGGEGMEGKRMGWDPHFPTPYAVIVIDDGFKQPL